jgi:hypothetical protein
MLNHWRELGGKKGNKFEENYLVIKKLLPKTGSEKW